MNKKLGTEDETNSGMEMNFGLCSLQAELTALLGMGGRPTAVGMAPERYLRRDITWSQSIARGHFTEAGLRRVFPNAHPPNTSMETPAEDTRLHHCTSSSWCE